MVRASRTSTSSAQVDGQSCGQAEAPIFCGRMAWFMIDLPETVAYYHTAHGGSTDPAEAITAGLLHAVACELFGNIGLQQICRRHIDLAAGTVAFSLFRHAAAIQRAGELRVELECGAVIGDGAVELIKP